MVSREQCRRRALAVPALAILCVASAAAKAPRAKPQPTPPTTTLLFDDTCTPGQRLTIAAVGDLLFHDALQLQAYKPGASFRQFWAPVASVLAAADITYGNLESPIAAGVRPGGVAHKDPGRVLDRIVYGRKGDALVFNVHPSVAADLKASGFKIVSTANNHAADRGPLGIDRSLDALTAAGLVHAGTRARATSGPWHARTRVHGVSVTWLACTYGLNGMPDPQGQVLQCHRDRDAVLAEIRTLADDVTVDAVIVTPHWGEENQHRPSPREKALARDMVEAGATAVIGAHPHVLQPWEKIVTADGREALVMYSLGNFISNQQSEAQRSGVIALVELTKPATGTARVSAAGYVPTFVDMSAGHRVTELQPGRSAYEAAMRILPTGNRVAMAGFRTLPRVCKRQAPVVGAAVQSSPQTMAAQMPLPVLATPAVALVIEDPPAPDVTATVAAVHVLDTVPVPPLPHGNARELSAYMRWPPPPDAPRKAREHARPVRPTARGHFANT
jgi:hypothetical protein